MSIAHFALYYCYIGAKKSIYLSQLKWFLLHIIFDENLQEIDICHSLPDLLMSDCPTDDHLSTRQPLFPL